MAARQNSKEIKITWDIGTGYDFLSSLQVLHFPDTYGLRGAWAAGVRSRLAPEAREFLENLIGNFQPPLAWLYSLPAPKDSASLLLELKRIPEKERLTALQLSPIHVPEMLNLLNSVAAQGQYGQAEQDEVLRIWQAHRTKNENTPITAKRAAAVLDIYANAEESGRRCLESLQNYYEVFFAEEEKRISEKLQQAVESAQTEAESHPAIETITTVIESDDLDYTHYILVPSYWYAPGSIEVPLDEETLLVLFASRAPEESLVPGKTVPEDMVLRMKAMTDPTRLRILRYLLQEQMTPAELARRLRLRAPTVTHHLHTLKKAGMVNYIKKGKNEHLYFAKMETIKDTYLTLIDFLEQDVKVVEGFDLFENTLF